MLDSRMKLEPGFMSSSKSQVSPSSGVSQTNDNKLRTTDGKNGNVSNLDNVNYNTNMDEENSSNNYAASNNAIHSSGNIPNIIFGTYTPLNHQLMDKYYGGDPLQATPVISSHLLSTIAQTTASSQQSQSNPVGGLYLNNNPNEETYDNPNFMLNTPERDLLNCPNPSQLTSSTFNGTKNTNAYIDFENSNGDPMNQTPSLTLQVPSSIFSNKSIGDEHWFSPIQGPNPPPAQSQPQAQVQAQIHTNQQKQQQQQQQQSQSQSHSQVHNQPQPQLQSLAQPHSHLQSQPQSQSQTHTEVEVSDTSDKSPANDLALDSLNLYDDSSILEAARRRADATSLREIAEEIKSFEKEASVLLQFNTKNQKPSKTVQLRMKKHSQIFALATMFKTIKIADGEVCPRNTVYSKYSDICRDCGMEALCNAAFGKLIKVFHPGIKTRRLGIRGSSRYNYCGIEMIEKSQNASYTDLHKHSTGNYDADEYHDDDDGDDVDGDTPEGSEDVDRASKNTKEKQGVDANNSHQPPEKAESRQPTEEFSEASTSARSLDINFDPSMLLPLSIEFPATASPTFDYLPDNPAENEEVFSIEQAIKPLTKPLPREDEDVVDPRWTELFRKPSITLIFHTEFLTHLETEVDFSPNFEPIIGAETNETHKELLNGYCSALNLLFEEWRYFRLQTLLNKLKNYCYGGIWNEDQLRMFEVDKEYLTPLIHACDREVMRCCMKLLLKITFQYVPQRVQTELENFEVQYLDFLNELMLEKASLKLSVIFGKCFLKVIKTMRRTVFFSSNFLRLVTKQNGDSKRKETFLKELMLFDFEKLLDSSPFIIPDTGEKLARFYARNIKSIVKNIGKENSNDIMYRNEVINHCARIFTMLCHDLPEIPPKELIMIIDSLSSKIMRELTMNQNTDSFSAWWILFSWCNEHVLLMAEAGGFLTMLERESI